MSPDLQSKIELELENLRRLLSEHVELVRAVAAREPSTWERSALAALLHGFYNGVENCFKRIVLETDEALPEGADTHRLLIEQMMSNDSGRNPMIDEALGLQLKQYMRFRHFFRHAYTFDLDWAKMSPLVEALERTLAEFESQLRSAMGPR